MKTTKDTRNIPVRREWLAELMSLLTPDERFVTKNGHLCLWTLPAKQLVFVVEEPRVHESYCGLPEDHEGSCQAVVTRLLGV